MQVVADPESPFSAMDETGRYTCPHCANVRQDEIALLKGQSPALGKANNKKIDCALLIHPDWLKGSAGKDSDGNWFGGSVTYSVDASRHYGKLYIEKDREEEFTVRDALVGINQLLNDESDTTSEAPPVLAEPYTRQFLRLFADKVTLERDQMQKYLRGTGVSPSEFLERGWWSEEKKVFTVADPLEWANQWKGKPLP